MHLFILFLIGWTNLFFFFFPPAFSAVPGDIQIPKQVHHVSIRDQERFTKAASSWFP